MLPLRLLSGPTHPGSAAGYADGPRADAWDTHHHSLLALSPHSSSWWRRRTDVAPGTHYNAVLSQEDADRKVAVEGKKGHVHLIHFDIGHAGGLPGHLTRFMVKFEYVRTEEPGAGPPSWEHTSPEWPIESMEAMCLHPSQPRMPALWNHIWR